MQYSLQLKSISDPDVVKAWRLMETGSLSPYLYYDYMKFIADYTRWLTLYRVRIACVCDESGKILMIVPLKFSLGGGYCKMLGDIQGCDRTDALYAPGLDGECRDALTSFFYSRMRRKMKVYRIQEGSPMLSQIPEERIAKVGTNPYVRLAVPSDPDAAIAALSSSVRQNLRTAYNRMRRDGREFTLEVAGEMSPVSDSVWKEIMDLYFNRLFTKYKGNKIKGVLSRVRWRLLYYVFKHDTKSLRSLPNARHIMIRDGSRLVAFMSGMLTHDKSSLTIPRLAINGEYRFYSPGYILIDKTLRYLSAQGVVSELDLSRGDEKYKFDMGGNPYITTDVLLKAAK